MVEGRGEKAAHGMEKGPGAPLGSAQQQLPWAVPSSSTQGCAHCQPRTQGSCRHRLQEQRHGPAGSLGFT